MATTVPGTTGSADTVAAPQLARDFSIGLVSGNGAGQWTQDDYIAMQQYYEPTYMANYNPYASQTQATASNPYAPTPAPTPAPTADTTPVITGQNGATDWSQYGLAQAADGSWYNPNAATKAPAAGTEGPVIQEVIDPTLLQNFLQQGQPAAAANLGMPAPVPDATQSQVPASADVAPPPPANGGLVWLDSQNRYVTPEYAARFDATGNVITTSTGEPAPAPAPAPAHTSVDPNAPPAGMVWLDSQQRYVTPEYAAHINGPQVTFDPATAPSSMVWMASQNKWVTPEYAARFDANGNMLVDSTGAPITQTATSTAIPTPVSPPAPTADTLNQGLVWLASQNRYVTPEYAATHQNTPMPESNPYLPGSPEALAWWAQKSQEAQAALAAKNNVALPAPSAPANTYVIDPLTGKTLEQLSPAELTAYIQNQANTNIPLFKDPYAPLMVPRINPYTGEYTYMPKYNSPLTTMPVSLFNWQTGVNSFVESKPFLTGGFTYDKTGIDTSTPQGQALSALIDYAPILASYKTAANTPGMTLDTRLFKLPDTQLTSAQLLDNLKQLSYEDRVKYTSLIDSYANAKALQTYGTPGVLNQNNIMAGLASALNGAVSGKTQLTEADWARMLNTSLTGQQLDLTNPLYGANMANAPQYGAGNLIDAIRYSDPATWYATYIQHTKYAGNSMAQKIFGDTGTNFETQSRQNLAQKLKDATGFDAIGTMGLGNTGSEKWYAELNDKLLNYLATPGNANKINTQKMLQLYGSTSGAAQDWRNQVGAQLHTSANDFAKKVLDATNAAARSSWSSPLSSFVSFAAPILAIAFPAAAPYIAAATSAYNASQGNMAGALMSGLSAYGGFTGTDMTGGLGQYVNDTFNLGLTAEQIKTLGSVMSSAGANIIANGSIDPMSLLTATGSAYAGNMLGDLAGSSLGDVVARNVIANMASGGLNALLNGGDPLMTAANGAINGAFSSAAAAARKPV